MQHICTKILWNDVVRVSVEFKKATYQFHFKFGKRFGAYKVLTEDAYRGLPGVNKRAVKGPEQAWLFASKFID